MNGINVTVSVVSNINIPRTLAKIDNDKFWTYAANEWWRLITPFTPMDTGTLFQSVDISPKTIFYIAPYAASVYNGSHINFRKDKHSQASAKWDKAAIPTQQDKLITALQKYADTKLI